MLGAERPSILDSMDNVAIALNSQGKYEEAEEMYRQVLQLRTKLLGTEHPDTLASTDNLAHVVKSQGK